MKIAQQPHQLYAYKPPPNPNIETQAQRDTKSITTKMSQLAASTTTDNVSVSVASIKKAASMLLPAPSETKTSANPSASKPLVNTFA